MIIKTDFPCGARVSCGDDLAVAEGQFPTFGRGRFPLRARGADRLIVELNESTRKLRP